MLCLCVFVGGSGSNSQMIVRLNYYSVSESFNYTDFLGACLAVGGETAILLHPLLPLAGVLTRMERGCAQNDRTLVDG